MIFLYTLPFIRISAGHQERPGEIYGESRFWGQWQAHDFHLKGQMVIMLLSLLFYWLKEARAFL